MTVSGNVLKNIFRFIRQHIFLGLVFLPVLGLSFLWVFPPRGVTAAYYANQNWEGDPVFSRREKQITLRTVRQMEENGTFPHEDFSVSWYGWLRIDREGEYTFSTLSDDGSFLFIDGGVVVNNGGFHPFTKASGTIYLTRGMHFLHVNYFQGAGDYEIQVLWAAPGKPETPISYHVLSDRPFPINGAEFFLQHLPLLYVLSWTLFLVVAGGRQVVRKQGDFPQIIKKYTLNLTLSAITVLVVLLVAEGIIRVVLSIRENRKDLRVLLKESEEADFASDAEFYSLRGMVQNSPYEGIVYELKPNLRGTFMGVPVATNSRGLRDVEYSYRKPENTFRIVGLGDSSLFGWGVRLEETSLKILERKLNEQSSSLKYEVINFSVPGYNTAIEVEVFLKKCLRYSPDLVIMHFNTNDYDVPRFMKPPRNYATLRKSYLLDFFYSRYQLLRGIHQEQIIPFVFDETVSIEETEHLDAVQSFPDKYRYMVGKKGFIRALDTLVTETKARDISLLVYVVKSYPGLDPNYTPNAFRTRQLQLITRLSQEKGFFLLNMYPYYMKYLKKHPNHNSKLFWVSDIDSHPSAIAHAVEAEAFYENLKQSILGRKE